MHLKIKNNLKLGNIEYNLFTTLIDMNSAVSTIGGLMLLARSKNNRGRRMLAYMVLLWGVSSIFHSIIIQTGINIEIIQPLRVERLIGGIVFTIFLALFPIEVLLPSWLNLRRLLVILSPVITLTAIYTTVLYIGEFKPRVLLSTEDLFAHIGEFNVWFRFLFVLVVVCYTILVFKLICRNEKIYVQWSNENYSDTEKIDISWMRSYGIFVILMTITWVLNTLYDEGWTFILHSLLALIGFGYFIYKNLVYESAYPDDFFRYKSDNPLDSKVIETDDTCENECPEEQPIVVSFEDKIPSYTETIRIWMDTEKPYLNKDFKLTDVCRVVPLNRSYMSRVFNEGFGTNFCQVVRKYRVEEAIRIMKLNPNMPIYEVAELSGFSSDTIFIRAFFKEIGLTPSKYVRSELK